MQCYTIASSAWMRIGRMRGQGPVAVLFNVISGIAYCWQNPEIERFGTGLGALELLFIHYLRHSSTFRVAFSTQAELAVAFVAWNFEFYFIWKFTSTIKPRAHGFCFPNLLQSVNLTWSWLLMTIQSAVPYGMNWFCKIFLNSFPLNLSWRSAGSTNFGIMKLGLICGTIEHVQCTSSLGR